MITLHTVAPHYIFLGWVIGSQVLPMGMIQEGPVRAPGKLKSRTNAHRTLIMYMGGWGVGLRMCWAGGWAGGLSSAGWLEG